MTDLIVVPQTTEWHRLKTLVLDSVSSQITRRVPMPTWVKVAIDTWTAVAGIAEGYVLRPINRADQVQGERMTEKVVWQLLQPTR
jgi:hypothetical protein